MNSADPKAGDSNELATKIRLSRELPNVKGNVWWHGYWLTGNYKGVADSLINRHQATLALPPAYGDRRVAPAPPRGLHREMRDGVEYLVWDNPLLDPSNPKAEDPVRYVVYEFYPDEEVDIENPEAIVAVTPFSSMMIGDDQSAPPAGTVYVVTALDRQNRESRPARL